MTSIEKAKKILENDGRCSELECSDYLQGSDTDCPCYKACTKTDSDIVSPLSMQICRDFLLAQAAEEAVKLPLYSEHDPVNKPDHYIGSSIECIDAIKASMSQEAFNGFLKGNMLKYAWRYEKKIAPAEDIKKAIWYATRLVKELEDGSKSTED